MVVNRVTVRSSRSARRCSKTALDAVVNRELAYRASRKCAKTGPVAGSFVNTVKWRSISTTATFDDVVSPLPHLLDQVSRLPTRLRSALDHLGPADLGEARHAQQQAGRISETGCPASGVRTGVRSPGNRNGPTSGRRSASHADREHVRLRTMQNGVRSRSRQPPETVPFVRAHDHEIR